MPLPCKMWLIFRRKPPCWHFPPEQLSQLFILHWPHEGTIRKKPLCPPSLLASQVLPTHRQVACPSPQPLPEIIEHPTSLLHHPQHHTQFKLFYANDGECLLIKYHLDNNAISVRREQLLGRDLGSRGLLPWGCVTDIYGAGQSSRSGYAWVSQHKAGWNINNHYIQYKTP